MLAAAGCWLTAAFGAWWFVKYHRHIPGVSYADLLWPGRWPVYRVSEGNHFIARAGELLRQGEANAALHHLRAGLARVPGHARGRTTLAELYLAGRRPDLAQEVMLVGLRHLADDPAYLRATLSLLLEFQEDAKLHAVAERVLAAPGNSASHALAATYAATAAYYRGNHDRAEDFIFRHRLQDSPDGALLLARLEWARGYPELALLRLLDLIFRQPGHDEARALLAGYYRDLGRTSEFASALAERLASDPLAPVPRIEYLQLHHQRGDSVRLERDAAVFLRQFQHDPAALLLLAEFAANTGRPALARRVQEILVDRRESRAAALLVAEAHLVAGEYTATLGLIAEYAQSHPDWSTQFASVAHGLRAVAHCGLGRTDDARLDLNHLLAGKNIRADNLVAVSHRLAALGARDLALTALRGAVEADPLNQVALTSLLRLELDTGNITALPAHLDRYLPMRQPSREILARAYAILGSDRHLFLPTQSGLLASLRTALDPGRP